MSLNHIPVAAVLAAEALDRASDKDELEAIWLSTGCEAFRGRARDYVMQRYRHVCARIDGNIRALRLARAM